MKISELIELLKEYPQDFHVVAASDPEGNSFDLLRDIGIGWYDPEADYDSCFSSYLYDEDAESLQDIERVRTLDESNAICIWP